MDKERFSASLKRIIETDTGYKAELRIFVSKGERFYLSDLNPSKTPANATLFVPVSPDLRVSGCYGLFVPGPSPSQVTMATLDWQTTLAVELAHSRALDPTRGVAIQVCLCS